MKKVWDWQFGVALLAAPIVWFFLSRVLPTTPNLVWPLYAPSQFLIFVVVYPIVEELAFRGWLQSLLYASPFGRRKFAQLSVANVITSLLFTACHFLYHPPLWALLVLIPSLLFGYFRDQYDSVKYPLFLHIFYNSGYYWLFSTI
ncbi:MAG: JDVT-CTERM system glutamic-type intramembrane protease [Candidatus Parabeggiatoa sp.]|nr:JDVT-CTERM system glutamic-type intramembrane protease [Candidatus Parabeggiatoa sp.]